MTTKLFLISVVLAIPSFAQVPAHTPHYPNISNGTVLYGAMGFEPSNLWPSINTWMGQRFDWVLGGGGTGDAHGGQPGKVYWAAYTDLAVSEPSFVYAIQSSANAHGLAHEGLLLHSSVDMQWNGTQFSGIDSFDAFEPPFRGAYVGGVFTFSGGSYTDVTASYPVSVSNTLYVGYMEPFDQMNFTLLSGRAGGSISYNYWNGSAWVPLRDHLSDSTFGLTNTGQVYFYPPADWTTRGLTVNVSNPMAITTTRSKYWIQVVVTGALSPPVYASLKGDNWAVASGANNARGWAAADSHRINIGTPQEYNPTPPPNATAKFRYQARVPGGANYVFGNPSDIQNGVRSWGKYMVDAINSQIVAPDNFDAAFFDDAGRAPNDPIFPPNAAQYYDSNHNSTWIADVTAAYSQIVNELKAQHGPTFAVGLNGVLPGTPLGSAALGDFGLQEAWWAAPTTYSPNPTYSVNGTTFYDWAAPANNPNNTKFYFQCSDTWSVASPWSQLAQYWSYWHYADRGNRTALMCLAMHYMGTNANTGFMYNGGPGGFTFYSSVDQVYTFESPTTITEGISADTSSNLKTIKLANTTTCSDGAMVQIGSRSFGDVVSGAVGRMYVNGLDVTQQLRTGVQATGANSWPNVFYAGDTQKFGSLSFTLATPSSGQYPVVWEYWRGFTWAPLNVADGTNGMTQSGTVTFTPPSDWGVTAINGAVGYWVRITSYSVVTFQKAYSSDWKGLTTTSPIYNSYPSGTTAYCVKMQHLATAGTPAADNVFAWTRWFPAMGVDIGAPDSKGLNGGARVIPWKTGDKISGQSGCAPLSKCADVWRRDFSKGMVLFRPWQPGVTLESELDVPSQPIPLGSTYYALKADGTTTGSPVTSVQLRGGEGAILICDSGTLSRPSLVTAKPHRQNLLPEDASGPSVFIDTPSSGATVSGAMEITGWAIDNMTSIGTGISSVQVEVDGTVIGPANFGTQRTDVCTAYPGRSGCPNVGFSYTMSTSFLSAGTHTITVLATNTNGRQGAYSIPVTVISAPLPSVFIDTPATGATVSGPIEITGWAIDNLTTIGTAIRSVQVAVDGVVVGNANYGVPRVDVCAAYPGRSGCPNVGFSYTLNSTLLGPGTHTITVAATDSDSAPDIGTHSISINVVSIGAPAVFLDSVAPGAKVSGVVTLSGWAIDTLNGIGTAISTVQILVDGSPVGTATYGTPRSDVCTVYPGRPGCPNVGFTYPLNTATLVPGIHTIAVVATDSDLTPDMGSYVLTVTVLPSPPDGICPVRQ